MKKILILSAFIVNLWALTQENLSIENAYIKQTPPNAKTTAIFLTIKNDSDKDIFLLKTKTNLSEISELHTHTNENGKMIMKEVPNIEIKAHSSTELKPGGLHIMIFDIKNQIDENTQTDLTLYFDNNQSIELKNIPSKELMKH